MQSAVENEGARGPAPGTWYLDPLHSSLIFVARYLRFGRVQGTFGDARGVAMVTEDPTDSKVDVTIRAASLNTGVAARDNHLRSADFLDVERHPQLRFVSTGIEPARRGPGAFLLHGELTLHGTTRPVTLDGRWVGEAPDYVNPGEGYGHFFAANTEIRLGDFGVGDGGALPWGGRLVGDTVDVVLEVRLQNLDPEPFLREIGHA
ncbi:YceI family protein [Marinitenerispora sediminis]|uniref:Polyisoprenoid-binding protein n=1 Tax=Marinitenerispora sediminis TaxID=1931232 RepID=A0A368SZ36_9ACTN|nr:YceI family protein [Marinitenerispora sediminis]RCV47995.1 polyisoprenoid-binding protein [Marinitenerispora sediminis]RCV49002.1 polyisoprenoid-binding protein [Marinitenerispora sediminis]RCV50589.1 polyisoprenoid-binding protein [Marinitenerispora sediminis]